MDKNQTQVELETLSNNAVSFAKDYIQKSGKFFPASIFFVNDRNEYHNMFLALDQTNPIVIRQILDKVHAESCVIVAQSNETEKSAIIVRAENIFGDLLRKTYFIKENNFDIMKPDEEEFHNRYFDNFEFATLLRDYRTLH